MDFSRLPYEVQFKYLMGLPYQEILRYCGTSLAALSICQTEDFWSRKAMNDFGIDLRIIEGRDPVARYATLEQMYRQDPHRLILRLIAAGDLTAAPDLLRRIDPNEIDSIMYDALFRAVNTGSPEILQQVLNLFIVSLTRSPGGFNDSLRGPFFEAVMVNRLDLANLLRPYYDPDRDHSEELLSWLEQWGHERDPKTLESLAAAGVFP